MYELADWFVMHNFFNDFDWFSRFLALDVNVDTDRIADAVFGFCENTVVKNKRDAFYTSVLQSGKEQ